jgi:hypothetical protein
MPQVGDEVITPTGEVAEVKNINVLRETVRAIIRTSEEDFDIVEYKVDDLKFTPRKRKPQAPKKDNQAANPELDELDNEDRKY